MLANPYLVPASTMYIPARHGLNRDALPARLRQCEGLQSKSHSAARTRDLPDPMPGMVSLADTSLRTQRWLVAMYLTRFAERVGQVCLISWTDRMPGNTVGMFTCVFSARDNNTALPKVPWYLPQHSTPDLAS